MAIHFEGNINVLIRDLQQAGFAVQAIHRVPKDNPRAADITLSTGAIIKWDAYSRKIWAEGPYKVSSRVERFLRRRYEDGLIGRVASVRLWSLLRPVRVMAVTMRSRRSVKALNTLRNLTRPSGIPHRAKTAA